MHAKDIMVEGANVVTVRPDDSIFTAIRLMLTKGISGLPVVEEGPLKTRKLVGMVTEGDLLRRRETRTLRRRPRWLEVFVGPGKLAEEYAHASGRHIREVMTTQLVTVTDDAPIGEIVQLMEQHGIKRIPVVRQDSVIGIITRANILRALVREAAKPLPLPEGDAAIRNALVAELKSQPWGSAALIDIAVGEGVVKLSGAIMDERARAAIVIAAENIPGVKAVEDNMVSVQHASGMVL